MRLFLSKPAVILLLLTAAACKPLPLSWNVPEGPPEYVQGFEDGCDSGVGSKGGIWYKYWYGFKRDPVMITNALYKQGWNEGYSYCRESFSSTDRFFN